MEDQVESTTKTISESMGVRGAGCGVRGAGCGIHKVLWNIPEAY